MKYFLIPIFFCCFFLKAEPSNNTMTEKAPHLELYISNSCPYCVTVLNYLKETNITVVLKNAKEADNLNFLLEHGKKSQVPCLFVDGKALYESEEIVKYLKSLSTIKD